MACKNATGNGRAKNENLLKRNSKFSLFFKLSHSCLENISKEKITIDILEVLQRTLIDLDFAICVPNCSLLKFHLYEIDKNRITMEEKLLCFLSERYRQETLSSILI